MSTGCALSQDASEISHGQRPSCTERETQKALAVKRARGKHERVFGPRGCDKRGFGDQREFGT
eukprot:2327079-Rhodomonas_salina.4